MDVFYLVNEKWECGKDLRTKKNSYSVGKIKW